MKTVIALIALAGTAAAAPKTRTIGGQTLPVAEDVAPAFDEGTYVAPAASKLAQTIRAKLVVTTLTADERKDLKVATLPTGLFLIRIHQDRSGKMYLYKPCDFGYHNRTLYTDTSRSRCRSRRSR
jgi:hypothetical protein